MAENKKTGIALWKKVIIILFVVIFGIGGYSAYRIYNSLYQPQIILKEKKTEYFYIHTGWKSENVFNALYEKNYVTNRSLFEWLAEKKNFKKHIFPGRYLLKEKMSYNEIINMLRSGKQIPVEITFDNLRTKQQIASRAGNFLETDSLKIMEIFNDNEYLKKYNLNNKTLFTIFIANTYMFNWNTSAEQFFERMYKESEKFWNGTRTEKLEEINFSKLQTITLASIVEMESYRKSERPVIAGVYLNRLKKEMPLQADPTIIFAVGDFTIKRVLNKHLEVDSPYNTYKNSGLPPGPICIPSISSIDAVLDYDKNNYLYFCAKEDFSGYHNFAVTFAQHIINAKKYQKALSRQ